MRLAVVSGKGAEQGRRIPIGDNEMSDVSGTACRIGIAMLVLMALFALAGCSREQSAQRGTSVETEAGDADGPGPAPAEPMRYEAIDEELWVDKVHVGSSVDANGQIAPDARADEFSLDDRVYLSMEVSEAPIDLPVLVTVVNAATNQELWSESRPIEAGISHLVFEVDPARLGSGEYRAEVFVGDERVSRHDFDVHA